MNKTQRGIVQAMSTVAAIIFLAHPAFAHEDDLNGLSFGEPGKPSQVDRTVKVEMKNMRFTPAQIKASAGETIRFVISNSDQADHEFVIGDAASQVEHRNEMMSMMQKGHSMQHTDPNAVAVGPGQTKNLVWKFTQSGKFEIDCNVPGHFEAGMTGVVKVVSD